MTKGGMPLMQALKNRRSQRSFRKKKLPEQLLSDLLWAAFGINRPDGKRTAPTASDRREIDIYVALEEGVYLYEANKNKLIPVIKKDIRRFAGRQAFTQKAPVNLIYVADLTKMGGSPDSKDFYAATDTGFISQNVYLFCASEKLATVVLGWVDRNTLSKELRLNSKQRIILTQPVGYPE
jgi:nitroreductase